jgi:hypothetical protein
MKKPITFLCAQPCIPYYAWQIEVMLTNFKDCGIAEEFSIHCLFAYNKAEGDWTDKVDAIKLLEDKFQGVAHFYFYEDKRVYINNTVNAGLNYISSIRPHIIKQHFKALPQLSQEAIFYHDCDIVFTKFPDFLYKYNDDDDKWYVSDTIGYIGYDYIVSKGEQVLDKMCEIVGINKKEVKDRQNQSGGAQYLMKGVDWMFFEKVEKDCETLFKEITLLNRQIAEEWRNTNPSKPPYHELQIWCSDMWGVLWNAWMRGYTTSVIKELDFCWATDNSQRWHETYIYHNAGVTSAHTNLFRKDKFRDKLPYNEVGDSIDKNSASYKYFSIIKQVAPNTCLKNIKFPQVVEWKSNLNNVAESVEPYDFDLNFLKFAEHMVFDNENQKIRADKRFRKCYGDNEPCENWKTNANGMKFCTLCGCTTKSKLKSDNASDCPIGKWEE